MTVPLARRNIFHEKGKLALSVAGVAASLALILLLMGFKEGLYATLTAYVDNIGADLIVAQSGVQGMFSSNSALALDIHDAAAAAGGAEQAGHIIISDIIFTRGETKTPVLLVGYDPQTTFGSPWEIGAGRGVERAGEILLDTYLAQRSDIALGDRVDVLGRDFTVVGLTRGTSSWMSPYIFLSLDDAEAALGLSGIVSYHLLRLPEGVDPQEAAKAVEAAVPGVDAMTPDEIASADRRVLANIMDTPINVMLFIGVIIGIAVMSLTAYTAVADQMREYGVLKAIGASRARLMRLVAAETLIRAGLGYLLGTGLSLLTAALIMARWPQFSILIRPETILQAGGLTLLMSLVAALLPIRRLDQIDPLLVFKT
ncbi:MAG: ABC transporter permease [Chloroflexi bacterium]|nr:ABC transporter permease [Chloroflexota bacterium]